MVEQEQIKKASRAREEYSKFKPFADDLRKAESWCELDGVLNRYQTVKNLSQMGYRKQSEGENISQMHPSDEFICEKCGLIIRDCCRYEIDEDDGDEICFEFPYRFCPRCGMKVKGGETDA